MEPTKLVIQSESGKGITERDQEIRAFFAIHSATPTLGNEYNVLSILWSGASNNWFSIVTNANNYKLVYNSQAGMNFDIEGRYQLFPPATINNPSGTHCTLVFDTVLEKKKFLTMLVLKFSNWKYEIKDFVTAKSSNQYSYMSIN